LAAIFLLASRTLSAYELRQTNLGSPTTEFIIYFQSFYSQTQAHNTPFNPTFLDILLLGFSNLHHTCESGLGSFVMNVMLSSAKREKIEESTNDS